MYISTQLRLTDSLHIQHRIQSIDFYWLLKLVDGTE